MKKLMWVGLMLIAGAAYAENPDKMPSLGLDYTQTHAGISSGLMEFFDPSDNSTNFTHQHDAVDLQQVTIDLRAPISEIISVTLHGGPLKSTMFGHTDSGYSIGAGLRVFLPWLQNK